MRPRYSARRCASRRCGSAATTRCRRCCMRSSSSRSASREAVRFRVAAPRDVALAMLDARFGTPQPVVAADGLAAFQQDALARVTRILQCRHGAILADSVGLGKTHVADALIRSLTADGGRVLVTGPAMLQAHWRRHLRHVRRWRWCSHTSLSRGGAPAGTSAWKLVVVDEAHAFRNPETHRYR